MLPSKPGHGIFVSVPASQFFSGVHSLASENTTMTTRYGRNAITVRPTVSFSVDTAVATGAVPVTGSTCSSLRAMASRSRASSLPLGFQNRSMTTTATSATREAMMSVSSTEM